LVLLTQVAFPQPHTGSCIYFWSGRFRGCALCGLRSAELGQERLSGDVSRVEGRRVDNEKRAGTRRAFEEIERHAVGTWSVARAARSIAPPRPVLAALPAARHPRKAKLHSSEEGKEYPILVLANKFSPCETRNQGTMQVDESAHSANFTNR
jgi:hypothetical protein